MFLRMRNGNDKRIPPTCLPQCNHITATEARIAQRQQTLFLDVNENLHRDY
jgi:hypothetical protein